MIFVSFLSLRFIRRVQILLKKEKRKTVEQVYYYNTYI